MADGVRWGAAGGDFRKLSFRMASRRGRRRTVVHPSVCTKRGANRAGAGENFISAPLHPSPVPPPHQQARHRMGAEPSSSELCSLPRPPPAYTAPPPQLPPPGRPLALSRCATARQPDPGAAQFSNTTNPRWLRSSEMRIWSTTRRTRLSMTSRLTRSRSESPIQTLLTSSRSGGSAINPASTSLTRGGGRVGVSVRVEHDLAQLARGGAAERDAVAQQ